MHYRRISLRVTDASGADAVPYYEDVDLVCGGQKHEPQHWFGPLMAVRDFNALVMNVNAKEMYKCSIVYVDMQGADLQMVCGMLKDLLVEFIIVPLGTNERCFMSQDDLPLPAMYDFIFSFFRNIREGFKITSLVSSIVVCLSLTFSQ